VSPVFHLDEIGREYSFPFKGRVPDSLNRHLFSLLSLCLYLIALLERTYILCSGVTQKFIYGSLLPPDIGDTILPL
jgi:hypothetical protein